METDVSGATSFSDIDLDAPQSQFGTYLDQLCPYAMAWGMSWREFWFESLDRLHDYWQANQFSIERRNQELWLQGIYIHAAIASCLDSKGRAKYPKEPYRITEMTDAEREVENQRKIERLREILNSHKQSWDMTHKGADSVDG